MDERSDILARKTPDLITPDPNRTNRTHTPTAIASRTSSPTLPQIPLPDLDLTCSFESILGTNQKAEPEVERVQKRASNVLKLTQENERLKEELRAMTARLEAAERRRQEIANRQQQLPTALVTDTRAARSS